MAKGKTVLVPLHQLTIDQPADCYAQLAEKRRSATRDGRPYYSCKFRDARKAFPAIVWHDSPLFEDCERHWQEGEFYKLRGRLIQHVRFGPQFELAQLRAIQESDREEGFDPAQLVVRSRYDSDVMLGELQQLATENIADEPLRRLVLTLLHRHAEALKRLAATAGKFYPFAGGLLE